MSLTSVPPLDFASAGGIPFREPARPPSDDPARAPHVTANVSDVPPTYRLLDDVQILQLPDPEWIVDGIIPRRSVVVIYGQSGACKTTLVAGLLTAIATGRDWFGHKIRHKGASVYVATEDVSGFKMRLSAAKRAARLSLTSPVGVYTFPELVDLCNPVSVGTFTAFLKKSGGSFECVVVDTYAAATAGAMENSSEDTTLAMTHAQQWRDQLNVTVILVHHTNAGGSRERGHSAMRGAADAMISLTPVDDVVHVESSKQRNGGPFETLTLKLVPLPEGGCVLKLSSDVLPETKLTQAQAKVLGVLRETFSSEGASKSEWQRACQDVPERTFHRVAKVLAERRLVQTVGSHFRITPAGCEAGS